MKHSNPNYGRPSGKKLARRLRAWQIWARGMAMVRQIDAEIKEKREKLYDDDLSSCPLA